MFRDLVVEMLFDEVDALPVKVKVYEVYNETQSGFLVNFYQVD